MLKNRNFQLIWHYLKHDRLKLILYLILVIITYIPAIVSAFLWGLALEALVAKNISQFILYIVSWELIHIICYSILPIPRDYLYNYLEIKFSQNVLKDFYHKVTELPAIAFEDIGVGEFINRMVTDPTRVLELLSKLIKMSCRALVVVIVFFLAFKTSIILGIEITIFCIVMGFISKVFFPKIKHTQEKIKHETDKYVKSATENFTGIREIKALGIKGNIEKRMYKNLDDLFVENKNIKKYEVIYYNSNNFVYYILQLVILLTCGYLYFNAGMTLALFTVISQYLWRIDEVVESISDFGINYNKISVSLKRIDEIVNNRLYNDEKFGKTDLTNIVGKIEFKNVSFRYRENEKNTLKNFSVNLEPNKKIAIIGKSGNGKSTIFNLLLRYFDVNDGEILIDNVNINDLTEKSLRNNISIIRQNPFLFNLSIIENFQIVKSDVSLEEIRKVCRQAYLDDYIMSLPKQYDTIIGEGGVNLSGGQKQRLAIARTLLLNTKIILFDEATSALDNESQEYIKKTIDNLVHDHTIIIVAHRLSTIVDADIIYIIDKGKLVDSGTHSELMEKSTIYKNLYLIENI